MGTPALAAAAEPAAAKSATRPAPTQPATAPTWRPPPPPSASQPAPLPAHHAASAPLTQPFTQPASPGPDTVILKELEALYEPVPFDHKTHARMAEMWDGCKTCHHRTPAAATQPATRPASAPAEMVSVELRTQDAAAGTPACLSCHEVSAADSDIHMPNLKGAYHRQCLNCHRDWMGDNACVICHKPKPGTPVPGQPGAAAATATTTTQPGIPTVSEIIGRMHPPIAAPETKTYRARFTPVAGRNALFRHREHVEAFGLRCVNCHHRDSCAECHNGKPVSSATTQAAASHKPLRPAKTWSDSHGPCMSCHLHDRCNHCHYQDDQQPPPPFDHQTTGQALDKDHTQLACRLCHPTFKTSAPAPIVAAEWGPDDENKEPAAPSTSPSTLPHPPPPIPLSPSPAITCGGNECHENKPALTYPAQRPGPVVAKPAQDQLPTRPARRAPPQP